MALYNTSIGGKNDRSSHCKEEVIGGALELDIFEKVMFPVCKLSNLVIEGVCVSGCRKVIVGMSYFCTMRDLEWSVGWMQSKGIVDDGQ